MLLGLVLHQPAGQEHGLAWVSPVGPVSLHKGERAKLHIGGGRRYSLLSTSDRDRDREDSRGEADDLRFAYGLSPF